ncbi:MAG: ABC transporter permease, partial [Chloroflexi bacterium]
MSIRASATAESLGATALEPEVAAAVGPSLALRRLLHHRSAAAGLGVLGVYILAGLLGPLLFPFNPAQNHLVDVFLPPGRPGHLLGTDNYGRDELLLILNGMRYTLSLGLLAVAIGLVVGVPLGAISGYFGGWVDIVIQRFTDVLLAFPSIVLALALVAGLGPGLRNGLVRADTLRLRELAFVEAARALGAPPARILLRHVIANALAPVIVQATLQMGFAILVAAGLGFFGLGVQPPTPEWGELLGEARNYIFSDPKLATFPGLAIFGA